MAVLHNRINGADVAQLVEQRFRKPQVIGSSPIVGYFSIGVSVAAGAL